MPHAVNANGQVANFPPTDPTEQRTLSFDFTNGLGIAETIAGTPTWTITVAVPISGDGVDATPNSRLIGSPSINGHIAQQQVGTCIAGVRYSLQAVATTSSGQKLSAFGEIACNPVT